MKISHDTHHETRFNILKRAKYVVEKTVSIIVVIFVTFLLLEIALYNLDPLGITRYYHGLGVLSNMLIPTEQGYKLPDGEHDMGHWVATIRDGVRVVPDTNETAQQTLVILGDSVAYGVGVNDNETFVNLIARELQEWHVINTAQGGYTMGNIERTLALYPDADCVIYLAIENDAEPIRPFRNTPYTYKSAIETHLYHYQRLRDYPEFEYHDWLQRAQALYDAGVLVVLFEQTPMALAVEQAHAPFTILPKYTGYVSIIDTHPNKFGHQQIADSLLPLVRSWCGVTN